MLRREEGPEEDLLRRRKAKTASVMEEEHRSRNSHGVQTSIFRFVDKVSSYQL